MNRLSAPNGHFFLSITAMGEITTTFAGFTTMILALGAGWLL